MNREQFLALYDALIAIALFSGEAKLAGWIFLALSLIWSWGL